MRNLKYIWFDIIYVISTLPIVLGGLLLLAFAVYEQITSVTLLIIR